MIWDDLFEAMLKGIAVQLGWGYSKARAGYILSKEIAKLPGVNKVIILTMGFTNFVDRNGKLKILMSPGLKGRPIDLGNYTMDELKGKNSKARRAIIVKLANY